MTQKIEQQGTDSSILDQFFFSLIIMQILLLNVVYSIEGNGRKCKLQRQKSSITVRDDTRR